MKLLLLTSLFLVASCLPDRTSLRFDDASPRLNTQTRETEIPDEVDFKVLSEEILVPKCISCHKGFTDETRILKHVKENDPEISPLFQSVKTGRMPKKAPPLESRELEIVRRYVESVRIERVVTYDELKEKILVPKCIECHKKSGEETNIMRWIDQENPSESKLIKATESGRMPKNNPKLSAYELNLIRNYLNNFRK
ncbi:hypothetical protein [Peredibacter starrii]|uniref:Cytochrome c domain-containing protein n=1 Tax=Peredibacter starrii TaxID=28202 RepID=A0AAX4HVA5_9BACT|nr:hypothetical protein [Peredibacter starrii]WPU66885.1 hypothetical protein SOO65_08995 [Peredibacter starrii]